MSIDIQEIIQLSEVKYQHEIELQNEYSSRKPYLEEIKKEINEVTEEIKKHNHIYLEDELADVLRDYINLLVGLKNEWYISNVNSVIETCKGKYGKRISDKLEGIVREETKKQQKKDLKERHSKYYNI